jgi:hypothetical protein
MVRTMIWAGNCLTRGSCTIDRLADYDDQPTEPRPLLSLQDHRAISAKRRLVYDLLWSVLLLAYLAALASFRLVSLANKPQGPTSRSI